MRRSGKRIAAAVLAVLLTATSVFGNVQTVQATEVVVTTEAEPKEVESIVEAQEPQSTTEEPTSEEPTSEEPTSEEPTSEEPTSEEPTSEELTSEEPTTEEPTSETKVQLFGTRNGSAAVSAVSISAARALEDNTENVTVTGTVLFVDGRNVYIADETAGIDIYLNVKDSAIQIGNTLTATGKKTTYKGLVELTDVDAEHYTCDAVQNELPAKTVTIEELTTDYGTTNQYQATRVYLENVVLGAINTGSNTVVTDQMGNTINIYRIPALSEFEEGDTVNLYAVVGAYNAIQLRVASQADITLVKKAQPEPSALYDPITDEMIEKANAVNVKTASETADEQIISVVGQVVYAYASKAGDDLINIVLEDVIDDEIYGYIVYDYTNEASYHVGDIVKVTGETDSYAGITEIKPSEAPVVLASVEPIQAQKLTLSQMGADYLSEYVCIDEVTLGAYNASGSTTITDASSKSVIYKGAAYPEGITEGSVVSVYAVCSAYNTNYQLRNGVSSDYVAEGQTSISMDESITLPVATFAGTADLGERTTVNGDLYAENDMQDSNVSFLVSTGKVPMIKNSNQTTGTTYSLGSTGLKAGEYYQFAMKNAYYGNMELSFRTKGSNTGARDFAVEYSTDGETYSPAGAGMLKCSYTDYPGGVQTAVNKEIAITDGNYSLVAASKQHEISVSLPKEANNAENLYIRIKVASDTSIKGAAIGNAGTSYINDIKITGNPVISDAICQYVAVSPKAGDISVGQELSFTTGTKDAAIMYRMQGQDAFSTYQADSKPVISELPCAVTVYATKDGIKNSVQTTYKFTQEKVEVVQISPNGGAVVAGSKVKLSCETENAQIYYAIVEAKEEDSNEEAQEITEDTVEETKEEYTWVKYTEPVVITSLPCTIAAKATKEGCIESAVKTANFTKRTNEKYNIYFGQMHAHTNYSDGAGSSEEAFNHAKNEVDNLDFLFITDHSNSFDNADSATINDGSVSTEWTQGHEIAEKYTDDTFVGLMGYEMTWSNGLGHINTFNTEGFQSRTQDDYKTYGTALNNYYNALQTAPDSISQFNHPGTTFGDFQDFAYYSEANDSLITLIEVGNGEGAIGSSGYFPSYEYYQRALDKGWHVSPSNNQDNHKGKWGDANTARSVVLADNLTEENIYDAMRNNRVYATEDNDLSVYYTLDDQVMGTVLSTDMVGEKVTLKVEVSDPTDSAIGKVDVITNGGLILASQNVTTNEASVTFEVENNYSFYYIKITQPDKDIAVTSPVWVGDVEAAGINALSTDTKLPIAGEALDVTLELYNNEKTALNIDSIVFSVGDEIIKTVDTANEKIASVASEATASYLFSYVHNKVGAMEIDVTVQATLDGVSKTYTDKLQLTYVNDNQVAHVVIDGSHYNDYVTGYYGGNMGNFIEMAADKKVKAEIVTTSFTEDTLKNVDMLIVSAPAKKSATANAGKYEPSHYEDSFLAIVKDYVANGGTVIVCGLADYQDSTTTQTAAETNKLLEAIGATIRMNSDEAYDVVNNGGQAYRLYYENINADDSYLAGFVKGQTYSAYSGCTVDITNAVENETVEQAIALVKGFDTTYSIDCKKDDGSYSDNSVYVEAGNVVALAYQRTKAGGAIFVGGSVFMSDFEVTAEKDNNDSLPYANYTIINNILETKKVTLKATDIATVRKAQKDEVFAIEGYVANGTDNENTKFFDTIYVEDQTGGITVFPFAQSGVKKGTKIRIEGYVDAYQGDKELQVTSYEILDDENLKTITPTVLSVKDAMDYENHGGSLIQVTGIVSRAPQKNEEGTVSEFWLTDGNGNEAAIFIDGYITSGTTGKNTIGAFVEEGATITAQGFLYLHPEGDSEVSVPVLRVADCDTITEGGTIIPSNPVNPGTSNTETESTSEDTQSQGGIVTTPSVITVNRENPVTILSDFVPLAGSVTDALQPAAVELALSEQKILELALLTKYIGNPLLPTGAMMNIYTSESVGISFLTSQAGVSSNLDTKMLLSVEKKELPKMGNSSAVFFHAETTATYGFQFMMHMNLGKEYVGKKAQIYTRETPDATPVLVREMIVNEIGNIAYATNAVTDVIVLIEE